MKEKDYYVLLKRREGESQPRQSDSFIGTIKWASVDWENQPNFPVTKICVEDVCVSERNRILLRERYERVFRERDPRHGTYKNGWKKVEPYLEGIYILPKATIRLDKGERVRVYFDGRNLPKTIGMEAVALDILGKKREVIFKYTGRRTPTRREELDL